MKKIYILHPFGFAIYFILNASTTLYRPSALTILISIFILLVFVYFLKAVIGLFVKNDIKCGIIASIILIPMLYYPQITKIFVDYCPVLARHRYVLAIILVCGGLLIKLILKTRRRLVTLTDYLNLLSLCFIVYGSILVWNAGMQTNLQQYEDILNTSEFKSQEISLPGIKDPPDIYYIILDAYAGSNALKKCFNFSNDDFISKLKERGFCVTQDSQAFMANTFVSMTSSLNMSNDKRLLKTNPDVLIKLIKQSQVEKILKTIGYKTINLSCFSLSDTAKFYGLFMDPSGSQISKMFKNTLFCILAEQIRLRNYFKNNMRVFLSLKTIPTSEHGRPRFIYAHAIAPHDPYLFDRNADIIPFWDRKRTDDSSAYIEQLLGTNKLILEVIDDILLKSEKKPIIIIQGDHGFKHGKHVNQTQLPILNAYYLPGRSCADLWPTISPYNSFRVIFNAYFKTDLKILEE